MSWCISSLLINSCILTLRTPCGIATSNSRRIPPDCIILDIWVFENFILADKPFAKKLYISLKLVYQLIIISVEN